jgi:hypothetical protein
MALQLIVFTVFSQSIKFVNTASGIPSSIRGLSVVNEKVAWFSGSKGHVGRTLNGGVSWKYAQLKSFGNLDFRSLYAFDSLNAVIANAGSPAYIFKTADGGKSWKVVYETSHPDAFFDGVDFWNDQSGIIYGDPIDGKMLLLTTNDGGDTWNEMSASSRPALEKGEASFAASGTTIRCWGDNKVVIATGGTVSRLWISNDKGEQWISVPSPIIQGKPSTGIFSVGINEKSWLIVGGDYQADSLTIKNSFYSLNEGIDWKSPAQTTRGYRSSVEFISGNQWLAAGQTGIDFSSDNGNTWRGVSDENGFHVIRRSREGNQLFIAGNGRIAEVILNP